MTVMTVMTMAALGAVVRFDGDQARLATGRAASPELAP